MKRLSALLPALWLTVFFAFPFVLVGKLSLSDAALAVPPYAPQFHWGHVRQFFAALDLETYARLAKDRLYLDAYLSSLRLAGIGTLLTLAIGYPLAYGIARTREPLRRGLLLAVMLPFWTSFLIRIYAWIAILKPAGVLNLALAALHLPALNILDTEAGVILGLTYAYLPFMVLPLYAVLE